MRAAGTGEAMLPADYLLSSRYCEFGELEKAPPTGLTSIHRQVLSHWSSRRDGLRAPRQRDIDPGAIRHSLPNLLIWEAGADGEYTCRLSGTLIDDTFAGPLTGTRLGQIPCHLIEDVRREFDMVRSCDIACLAERTIGWAGKPFLFYRHLLLPLTHETQEVERLLSVLTFHPVGGVVARAG